jgi:ABC-type phosphate transport system substrate-binding protein
MKSKDLALVLVMVFIGAIAALIVSHFLFGSPSSKQQTAEIVDPITADFSAPPQKYFNTSAVNAAPQIQIGGSNNPNPFSNKSQ